MVAVKWLKQNHFKAVRVADWEWEEEEQTSAVGHRARCSLEEGTAEGCLCSRASQTHLTAAPGGHQFKEIEIMLILSPFWSWQARDRRCLISACVLRVYQRFWSASGMPAKRTILCLGIHKNLLYFPQISLHCKAQVWGQERTDVKPYCKKSLTNNCQTHLCTSLCELRFHTGIWTGAVSPDLALAAPCLDSWPVFILLWFLSAAVGISELSVAEKQQPLALCCSSRGEQRPPAPGNRWEGNLCPLAPWVPVPSGQALIASSPSWQRQHLPPVCRQGAPAPHSNASAARNHSQPKLWARGAHDALLPSVTNMAHKPGPDFDSSYWKSPDKCCLSLSCCCF